MREGHRLRAQWPERPSALGKRISVPLAKPKTFRRRELLLKDDKRGYAVRHNPVLVFIG